MIERHVRGNAPQPRGEVSLRMESRVPFVHTPKSLHGQVLRRGRIAYHAHNPPVHIALVLPEKRFKGVQIARRESLQQFHPALPSTCTYRGTAANVTFILKRRSCGPGSSPTRSGTLTCKC